MARFKLGAAAVLAFAWLLVPFAAHAAESYDNCTGFITSLPAVIATPGTWCLKQDLATALTGGEAITISTNNVTIDCNDFKLGGLAAGLGTTATGIFAANRLNEAVRHCNIRGFFYGINISGGGGHVIEDNRLNGNTVYGIFLGGDGSVLRRNQVFDTGGSSANSLAWGLYVNDAVDILDNTINNVTATSGHGGYAMGIRVANFAGGTISGNRVRGVLGDGAAISYGIYSGDFGRVAIHNNDLLGVGTAGSIGISCGDSAVHAQNNTILGFATAISTCTDNGNLVAP